MFKKDDVASLKNFDLFTVILFEQNIEHGFIIICFWKNRLNQTIELIQYFKKALLSLK